MFLIVCENNLKTDAVFDLVWLIPLLCQTYIHAHVLIKKKPRPHVQLQILIKKWKYVRL